MIIISDVIIIKIRPVYVIHPTGRRVAAVDGDTMKAFNKRLNKRKASKVTMKNHRKSSHPPLQDEVKGASAGASSVRPEEIKIHQHY